MGRLDKVLRISVSLPPFEINYLFQEDNLFLNLSSIESHQVWFTIKIPTTPEKVSLNLLQSSTDNLWHSKQGNEVNGEARQSTSNKCEPPAL